jgi:(2Fe-2S) ferredoxin
MTTYNLHGTTSHLLICNGSSCKKHQGKKVAKAIEKEIEKQGAEAHIHTTVTHCNGRCSDACVVIAYPQGVWYRGITPQLGKDLVRCHLQGEILQEQAVYTYEEKLQAVNPRGNKGKKKKRS